MKLKHNSNTISKPENIKTTYNGCDTVGIGINSIVCQPIVQKGPY
jgi:hypothetical protein